MDRASANNAEGRGFNSCLLATAIAQQKRFSIIVAVFLLGAHAARVLRLTQEIYCIEKILSPNLSPQDAGAPSRKLFCCH